MKKTIIKTIFFALLLVIAVFSIASCTPDENGGDHVHSFIEKVDDSGRFMECACGEIKNKIKHNFEWIIDSEPTYTASGYKHKECTNCTYKTDENTIIERLIHTDGFDDRLTIDLPNKKTFANKEKLVEFYEEQKSKINYSFLCMDASSEPENGIYTTLSPFNHYSFHYSEETEDEYTTPFIVISYGIYSNELGPIFDEAVDGVESASFLMYFYGIDSPVDSYQIEFYEIDDPKSAFDFAVQIMSGDICIGTIFYSTDVYINREWMADYLLRNLFVIN